MHPQEQPGEFANLAQMWEAGGWAMYPITLLMMLGGLAAMLALIFVVIDRHGKALTLVSWSLLALGLLTIGVGAWARAATLSEVDQILQTVNPADAETIRAYAQAEAQVPWKYGLLVGTPLALLGGGLLLLRPKKPAPQDNGPIIEANRVQ